MNPFARIGKFFQGGRSEPPGKLQARNLTRQTLLACELELAGSGGTRRKGLLGRSGLAAGHGLWIVPCESVHTFFMRFPIDLVYLDRKRCIRKLRHSVPAWRVSVCWTAHSVIELPAGAIRATRSQRGDTIEIGPRSPAPEPL